jgi:hypothetical protein
VPELGLLGSVRGALSNERPYRECEKSGVRPFTMYVSRALMDFCCRGLESRP